MSSSAFRNLSELRKSLEMMDTYRGPSEALRTRTGARQDSPATSFAMDHARLHQARDQYLQQRLEQVYLDHVLDGGGAAAADDTSINNHNDTPSNSNSNSNNKPTAAQTQQLVQDRDEALHHLWNTIAETDTTVAEFQAYHRAFLARKDELQSMIRDLEEEEDDDDENGQEV